MDTKGMAPVPGGGGGGGGGGNVSAVANSPIYSLYIVNKAGGLIYQKDYAFGVPKLPTGNDYLVAASTFHSLHAISGRARFHTASAPKSTASGATAAPTNASNAGGAGGSNPSAAKSDGILSCR